MSNRKNLLADIDGLTALIYLLIVAFGLINIFAAVYDPNSSKAISDFSLSSTKQLIWIGSSFVLIILIMSFDFRTYETFAYLVYGGVLLLLALVLVLGTEVNNSRSWIDLGGGIRLQPSEFAKFATALALAKYLSAPNIKPKSNETYFAVGLILALPVGFILLQGDAGSALVFSSLLFVLYREQVLPHWILFGGILMASLFVLALSISELIYLVLPILSITLLVILLNYNKNRRVVFVTLGLALSLVVYVYSVKFIFDNVLKPHQQDRIMVLIDPEVDRSGTGVRWNLKQSKIAIGSGGLWGKGFLQGTQTKLDYVPEQSTDFIFCTVGEEHGWIGSSLVILLFMALLYRIILIAERQRDSFGRVYGYAVASIIFFHFAINIAMTIGLFPVVGIPLPFISYGGSSLWSFTILLFILLKLDAHREQQMLR